MASESSFDVVSSFDRQEVDNALNQAIKEVANRYDFRGVDATLEWKGENSIEIYANSEDRVQAALDILIEKLVRRNISMKTLKTGDPISSGKGYRMVSDLIEGIDKENAKKITKLIRDEAPKGVKTQIQGEAIRVSSKKRDDLQDVISLLKGADLEIALQFNNYR